MKIKGLYYFAVVFVLTLLSCTKKPLPTAADDEVLFYLKGDLEGKAIVMEAGKNNYFLSTSYSWDTNSVCKFRSDLVDQSCNGPCNAYKLSIILNDSELSLEGSKVNLDGKLRLGSYAFNDKDLPSLFYRLDFTPLMANASNHLYSWTIESANASATVINEYCPSIVLSAQKVYSTTLHFDDNNGCGATHQNIFQPASRAQATINAVRNLNAPGAHYDFVSHVKGMAPFKYKWDFGDGSFSDIANPSHSYQIALNGKKTVSLQVIDANQDTCITYYQIQTSADPSCEANFSTAITGFPDTKAFSKITIIITDPNGHVYSSKNVNQPRSSYFEITDLANYIEDGNHHPTKRIIAKLSCVLSDGTQQIKLTNAFLSVAFAYSN